MCTSNRESIEKVLAELDSPHAGTRFFAARTLGDIGRSKNGALQSLVLNRLQKAKKDTRSLVRSAATFSIQEIEGKLDAKMARYNPLEPVGSVQDQYYLKRG